MTTLAIDEFLEDQCVRHHYTLEDYESDQPRWCKGCGDHGVLGSMQRVLQEEQVRPEDTVCVSGIGCSSRFPHYLNAYGLHGIHGRALPLAIGVALARPELRVMAVMGDGDCFSIGAGHWLHTLRYNINILVLVLDNEIYALTKKQVSPTSPEGAITNTTPHGAYLKSLNPLSVIMGVPNVSFLAQTATWVPPHLEDTLRMAWRHEGLSFVRILSRCPVYTPDGFGGGGVGFSGFFLEHSDGVPVTKGILRKALVAPHDPHDLPAAQIIAARENPAPLGLLYWNPDIPTYGDIRRSKIDETSDEELVDKLNAELDKYTILAQ
ncbi:MAG: thiamine pyrophosphate-dependent enzyme [bacterium]